MVLSPRAVPSGDLRAIAGPLLGDRLSALGILTRRNRGPIVSTLLGDGACAIGPLPCGDTGLRAGALLGGDRAALGHPSGVLLNASAIMSHRLRALGHVWPSVRTGTRGLMSNARMRCRRVARRLTVTAVRFAVGSVKGLPGEGHRRSDSQGEYRFHRNFSAYSFPIVSCRERPADAQ
jgi:hypothetical protein